MSPLRAAGSLLALFALVCTGYVGAHDYSQKHRASETAVLRATLDSTYAAPELMLSDHFESVDGQRIGYAARWLADSLPDVARDLIRDFNRVATDESRIEPFELGRSKLHLLADSTLARFFGRYTPGWEGFRRAFPGGGPIVSVSRVGLSRDGHWAMVYVGSQGDWLAGAGYFYILYNDTGVWRERHRQVLWIS